MKRFALLAWLLGAAALAQVPSQPVTMTTGDLNLWVTATGNDNNSCLLPNQACASIHGAVNKVPRWICHIVTINVGVGTFVGATIDGFNFCAARNSTATGYSTGKLIITGTLINATATTGDPVFQFTSQTAGDTAATWGVLNKTSAGWTVNNFRGKLVEAISGGGAGTIRIIKENAADSISLVGASSASATTATTWAVRDWGTLVSGGTYPPATLNWSGFIVGQNNPSTAGVGAIEIRNFRFPSTTARALYMEGGPRIWFRQNRVEGNQDTVFTVRGFNGEVSENSFAGTGNRYAVAFDWANNVTLRRNMVVGNGGNGPAFRMFTVMVLLSTQNYFLTSALAAEAYGFGGEVSITGSKYDGTGTNWPCLALGSNGQGVTAGVGKFFAANNVFTNCSGSAIFLDGPVFLQAQNNTGSTGNARYGFELKNGARVQLVSGNTVTGGLGDTAIGITPTVTAYGSISTGISETDSFTRIHP